MWQIAQIYTFDKALVGRWFSQKLVLCENNAKRSGSTLPSCPLRRIYGAGWGNIKLGMSTIYKTHVNYFQQTIKQIKALIAPMDDGFVPEGILSLLVILCKILETKNEKYMIGCKIVVQQFAKKKRNKRCSSSKACKKETPVNRICKPVIH